MFLLSSADLFQNKLFSKIPLGWLSRFDPDKDRQVLILDQTVCKGF